MKTNIIILIGLISSVFISCERPFLDPWPPDGARTPEIVWNNYDFARGFLDQVYADQIMLPYVNDISGYGMLASATDEAEHSVSTAGVQDFTNGVWNPSKLPSIRYGGPWAPKAWRSPWENSYQGIRKVNMFLEGVDNSVIIDDLNIPSRRYDRTYFKGQAYFWRAYLQFQLLRNYGRFVISTSPETVGEDLFRDRNTLEESVAQILKDCNSAIDSLPHTWDEVNWHRANKAAAMALKSRLLLYYASPLYQGDFESFGSAKNTVGDVQRWIDAADAAREAINENEFYTLEKVTKYTRPFSNSGTYNDVVHFRGNLLNKEIIFSTPKSTTNSIFNESYNLPAGIDGFSGYTNPTQEMVDAFEVVNSETGEATPFNWENPEHANDPYKSRDPRFYASILYNDYLWGASSARAYKIETYEGGDHRNPLLQNSTKTGYYYRKFLSEGVYKYVSGHYSSPSRNRHEFRFTELFLNYAEAMNEAYGPEVADPKGSLRLEGANTAKAAIDLVRARVNMPPLPEGLSQDEMREKIKHERRIELCFEGHRFYDLRRWKEGNILGNPIHGVKVTATEFDAEGNPIAFDYKVEKVEDRVWSDNMYWWPIPYSEISKYAGELTQNPGW